MWAGIYFLFLNLIGESRVSPPQLPHTTPMPVMGPGRMRVLFCLPGENQALDERKNSDIYERVRMHRHARGEEISKTGHAYRDPGKKHITKAIVPFNCFFLPFAVVTSKK